MLAVVPVRSGTLPAGALETIAECGGRALLVGSGVEVAVGELTGTCHEAMLLELGDFAPARWAGALAGVLCAESVVLPASPDGRDLAARLAATLDVDLYAGAMLVMDSHVAVVRGGGHVILDVHPMGQFVATLQPGVRGVEPQQPDAAAPEVRVLETPRDATPAGDDGVEVVAVLPPDAATMDLAESPRIVAGGAGLESKEKFEELAELAAALDASLGATRVITDRGWLEHERQIGTTGVVVDPSLYIAFGISGAVQHTSGLGSPDHIISVNTDPHCPMMQLADLAIVSDANAVVSELLSKVGGDA